MDSTRIMTKEGFPTSVRVKKESEFRRIIEEGTKRHGQYLILFRLKGAEGDGQRFGIKIAKGLKGAVVRNGIKRAIRESLRKNRHRFGSDESVVVLCKTTAGGVDSDRLREQLESLIR